MNTAPPVHCSLCDGIFIPPAVSATNAVQCPHCAGQMLLAHCRPAALAAQQAVGVQMSEREAAALQRESVQQRRSRWLGIAGGALAAGLVAFLLFQAVKSEPPPPAAAPVTTGEPPPPPPLTPEDLADLDDAEQVARQVLAAPTWQQALPLLRCRQRIQPLMSRYHAARPWAPVPLKERRGGRIVVRHGHRWADLDMLLEDHRVVHLLLEKTPSGWRFDWEGLVNAPAFEWAEFYAQKPTAPRRLRVTALRGSVTDGYMLTAGCEPAETLAVTLFSGHRGDSVIALVPKDSDLGRMLALELTWEAPRDYLCELRTADPQAVPPRVNLIAVLQKDWYLPD